MCRGFMGCIIVSVNVFYLLTGLALAVMGGLLKWNDGIKQRLILSLESSLETPPGDMGVDVDIKATAEKLFETMEPAALGIFCLGIVIMVIAIIAFIGICCHVTCMLVVYAVITGVLVLGLLILVIIYFANKSILMKALHNFIKETQMNYENMASSDSYSQIAAVIMTSGQCCGYNNGEDFKTGDYKFAGQDGVKGQPLRKMEYPLPCCKNPGAGLVECPQRFTIQNSNIGVGCSKAMDDNVSIVLSYAIYGAIGALVVNLLLFGLTVGVIVMRKKS